MNNAAIKRLSISGGGEVSCVDFQCFLEQLTRLETLKIADMEFTGDKLDLGLLVSLKELQCEFATGPKLVALPPSLSRLAFHSQNTVPCFQHSGAGVMRVLDASDDVLLALMLSCDGLDLEYLRLTGDAWIPTIAKTIATRSLVLEGGADTDHLQL